MLVKLDSTKWLRKKIATFEKNSFPYLFAAILHIYFSNLNLKDIAEKAGITLETLQGLRTNPRFMHLVDTFKKEYSQDMREDLLVNSYQLEEYDSLASDFSLFDEVLQMQIRVPLFSDLKKISERIKSRATYGLKIDTSEFMLFRRLFSFFILIEKYIPTLISKSLQEMKQIAEDIVWPGLNMDAHEIDRMLNKPIMSRDDRIKKLKENLDKLS